MRQPQERSRRKPRHHEPSRPDTGRMEHRVAACDAFTPGEARKNDELTTLRTKLADKTQECTELHHQLDAAATAIAALHRDNTLLRRDLHQRGQLVALQVHR